MVQLTPKLELILMDESGSTAAVVIHLASGTSVDTAAANAEALAAVVLSASGCVLVRQRIVYKVVSEETAPAAIGSSIKRCGVFIFEDIGGDNDNLVQVPGIIDDVLVTDGPGAGILIDQTNANIEAFIGALLDADFVNPFDVECFFLVAAYRQSRV